MYYFLLIIGIIIAGCAQEPKSADMFVNLEAPGNLQSNAPLGCIDLSTVTNKSTPADIYPGVAKCIQSGDYKKAGQLFALAGIYGRFDILRVSDSTAHQAIQVLQMNNFKSLTEKQREEFIKSITIYSNYNSIELLSLCNEIKKKGAPGYYPAYMIQHGMGAFVGSAGNGIKSDFDAAKSWRESLQNYLHCP